MCGLQVPAGAVFINSARRGRWMMTAIGRGEMRRDWVRRRQSWHEVASLLENTGFLVNIWPNVWKDTSKRTRIFTQEYKIIFSTLRASVWSKGLFTWRWGTPDRWCNPLRWGNPPVHIISHFNLITFFMIGGVTRQILPHLPVVSHLHVNRP